MKRFMVFIFFPTMAFFDVKKSLSLAMREVLNFVHPGVTADRFLSDCICNSSFMTAVLQRAGSSLQKWRVNPDGEGSIRYPIEVAWPGPVSLILGVNPFCVRERRRILRNGLKVVVESAIQTDFSSLTASIYRVLQNKSGGCNEELTIVVDWDGVSYKDQIECDFCTNLKKRIIFADAPAPLQVARMQVHDYHTALEQFQALTGLSEQFLEVLEDTHIDQTPLVLPNGDQIARIGELMDPNQFSIHSELREMKAEADRTQRIVEEIRQVGHRNGHSSSLPVFVTAACAAFIAIVIAVS
jgi:hypothetical protein